jgi:hypothetical protein
MRYFGWTIGWLMLVTACGETPTGTNTQMREPADQGDGDSDSSDDDDDDATGDGDDGPAKPPKLDAGVRDKDAGKPSGDASTDEPAEVEGCEGTTLYEVPADTSEPGPWPVGVRTINLPLNQAPNQLTVEVWYPAKLGSDSGKTRKQYDLREFLKQSQRAKVPDDEATSDTLLCHCYEKLELDTEHGPYPVVFYIHGTAAMRIASATQMTHWASRGFVVVAADHPGMMLADMLYAVPSLNPACWGDSRSPQDVPRDIDLMLGALEGAKGDFSFLAGHVDMERVGMTGHSQGAGIAADMGIKPGVRISIPLAGRKPVMKGPDLESVLFFGGEIDSLVTADAQRTGYEDSPAPKRQVLVANAEHLFMTDLCGGKNKDGLDAVQIAEKHAVCGIDAAAVLWKCSPEYIGQEKGTEITNYTTTAALEETLHCQDRKEAFSKLETRYAEVSEFSEDKP